MTSPRRLTSRDWSCRVPPSFQGSSRDTPGITTERDLGTEGALDFDVQLKRAIEQGVVAGPRLITVTRAIVATGSYGPRRTDYSFDPLQGAEEATGAEEISRVVRRQIGYGADWIKVYADYRWGPGGETADVQPE